MGKDMRIATTLAEQMGAPSRLGNCAVEVRAKAANELPPDADHTQIASWLRHDAKEEKMTLTALLGVPVTRQGRLEPRGDSAPILAEEAALLAAAGETLPGGNRPSRSRAARSALS
jgi:hypothetical protein